jgi:hypothetical protein
VDARADASLKGECIGVSVWADVLRYRRNAAWVDAVDTQMQNLGVSALGTCPFKLLLGNRRRGFKFFLCYNYFKIDASLQGWKPMYKVCAAGAFIEE